MNDYNEIRFWHLRALSYDDKLSMIEELEKDIEEITAIAKDPNTSSEQRSELYSDIAQEESRIEYLKSILDEKHL
jgi:hypothetical protein